MSGHNCREMQSRNARTNLHGLVAHAPTRPAPVSDTSPPKITWLKAVAHHDGHATSPRLKDDTSVLLIRLTDMRSYQSFDTELQNEACASDFLTQTIVPSYDIYL